MFINWVRFPGLLIDFLLLNRGISFFLGTLSHGIFGISDIACSLFALFEGVDILVALGSWLAWGFSRFLVVVVDPSDDLAVWHVNL